MTFRFNTLQVLGEEPLNYFSRRGALVLNADYSLQRRRAVFGQVNQSSDIAQ